MTRVSPTRDGWILLGGSVGLALVAWISSNNLLYLVSAPVWAVLLLAWPLGAANVSGVTVRREFPGELYAGRAAAGALLVHCPRRVYGAAALVLHDEGTGATGTVDWVRGNTWSTSPVGWRFGDRGAASLSAVWVQSTFPFGMVEHRRRLPLPAEVLVYPRPQPSTGGPRPGIGDGPVEGPRAGGTGDLVELRGYQPGDAMKRIHWPTTARLGQLVVAERAEERSPVVVVEVTPVHSGPAWERELSRACGEIHRALATGHRVGLVLPELADQPAQTLAPARGGQWRRALLDALARMPRVDP